MPWEKKYDDHEVLERAMMAFWARGYEATSVNDLVATMGLNRGSLYSAFGDKHALFLAALSHYDRTRRADYLNGLAARHRPKAAILAVFHGAAGNRGEGDIPAGCLLVNTALELSPHDPVVRAFVKASLAEVEDFFCQQIEAGREAGEIPDGWEARHCAQALLGLLLGLRVLTRGDIDPEACEAVVKQAESMLS